MLERTPQVCVKPDVCYPAEFRKYLNVHSIFYSKLKMFYLFPGFSYIFNQCGLLNPTVYDLYSTVYCILENHKYSSAYQI